MKIILIMLILMTSTVVGFSFGKRYKEKKDFFRDYLHFLNFAKSQIGYSSYKIKEILKNAKTIIKNNNVLSLLEVYNNSLINDNKIYREDLEIINFLNSNEKNEIVIFLNKLGTTDLSDQREHLTNHISIINEIYEKAKIDSCKYLPLYTKLGLLVGLFIIVIIM